jgi:enamine deaminase RidA (YjgF/YER057c/UK114 family)
MSPEERWAELAIAVPDAAGSGPPPLLAPVIVHDGLAFLSGTGDVSVRGYVGGDVTVDEARAAARTAAHLLCRALRSELGSLDRVERWVKVLGLVRSAPGFTDQPRVINAFSEAVAELWGQERGICARSAIGVAELPGGMAVEVEAVVALA